MGRPACLIVTLSGCGALLSVGEADDEPNPTTIVDAGPPTSDGGTPGSVEAGRDDRSIDCLGVPRQAFLCDGFESTDPGSPPQAPWARDLEPEDATEVSVSDSRRASGARSMLARLGGGSNDERHAKVRWQRPEPGPIALQFSFNVAILPASLDNWNADNEAIVAAIRAPRSGTGAVLRMLALGAGSGRLVLDLEGTDAQRIDLGTIPFDRWHCVQIVSDEDSVSGYLGGVSKGTRAATLAAETVELGLDSNVYGKDAYFDDVIISPSLVDDCAL